MTSPASGVVIGRVMLPLVYEGEAVFHIARVETPGEAAQNVDQLTAHSAAWDHEEPRIV